MLKKIFKLSILDISTLLIVLISFVSIFFLSIGKFKVDIVLILSAILILLVLIAKKEYITFHFYLHKNIHLFPILLLILIAVLFRNEPYLYVMGGQDQGVYVNMSKVYENRGEVFQIDQVRKNLKQANIKNIYDRNNLRNNTLSVKNKFEGCFVPGVYIADESRSKYVFQFYHLHPLWMAIFGNFFGDQNRVYSLVFFSLISIISFYFLAFEYTKSIGLAFIVGFLLAINPLHAFFSKFPVTEVVALGFTSAAFYYLVRYYKLAKEKDYNFLYLMLSAGLMGCFFFTRISGFMYIPFFYVMLLSIQLYIKDNIFRRQLVSYVFMVFSLYIISVFYGLHFSYPYAHEIYLMTFGKILGSYWHIILIIISTMLLFLYFVVQSIEKTKFSNLINKVSNYFIQILPYLFLLVIAVGLLKIYQLGFTDKFLGNSWIDLRWHMAGTRWGAFLYSSLIVAIKYLSPFIFILFIIELFSHRKKVSASRTMLLFFLFCFWGYIAFLQNTIPYQYYYARYLLSEVIPYTLLFALISAYNSGNYTKKGFMLFKYLLIFTACIYSFYFTLFQFKGNVADGAYDSLKQITNSINKNDLILLDKNQFQYLYEIRLPLIYQLNKNVFLFNNTSELYQIMNSHITSEFNDVFILSQRSYYYNFLMPIDRLNYQEGCYEHTNTIPTKFFYKKTKLFLYKFNLNEYWNYCLNAFKIINIYGNGTIKTDGFHDDNIWTEGRAEISDFDITIDNEKCLVITTYGYNPYRNDIKKLGLKLFINGRILNFLYLKGNEYYFSLPPGIHQINKIIIQSNIFIPAELGINKDTRRLGIDLKIISFK